MPEIGEAKAKEPNELDHLFIEPIATELEQMREEARKKWRITYDCFSAKVKGDKVVCAEGYLLGRRLTLLSVLRGQSSRVCQDCSMESYPEGGSE